MKALVIYQTRYGSTKQYAQWIADQLKSDIVSLNDLNISTLKGYDLIIFGSYMRIGKIVDASFIIKNWPTLQSKQIVLFSVSGAKPGSSDLQKFYEDSFPADIRSKVKYFQLWGRVSQLNFLDNLLMMFPITVLKIKAATSGKKEDQEKLAEFHIPVNHVTKEAIFPLTKYIQAHFV